MNPYISSGDDSSYVVSVNKITPDDLGDITLPLSYLSDIEIGTASVGQVLAYNGSKWANSSSGGGATTLSALTDCTISSASDGQVLKFNGSRWVNAALTLLTTLSSLTDCTITSASDGQVLKFNGSKWVNATLTLLTTLSSLTDCTITSPSTGQVLKYNGSKWVNASDADSLATLSDVSVSSPSNDQVLVFTTDSSLNKWTPYTLSGATFNDTNKTITLSGTTALSGLTTDVTISSASNNQALVYVSGNSKWQNTTLSSSLLTDFNVSNPANGQVLQYNTATSKFVNASLATISVLSALGDCVISLPSDGQILTYDSFSSKWKNSTQTSIINPSEIGTLTQMYDVYGGGIGGAGIAQNAYFTVPSYVDNVGNSTMFTNYAVTIGSMLALGATNCDAVSVGTYNVVYVNNNITSTSFTSPFRVNMDYTSSNTIALVTIYLFNTSALTIYVYGSNSATSYSDTSYNSRTTDANLTLLATDTSAMVNGDWYNIYSSNTTIPFRYVHIFFNPTTMKWYNIASKTGSITKSDLVKSTDYVFDSDPTTGNPRIKNLKASVIKGNYNALAVIWNELGRRIYPVVRGTNEIYLTDGTTTTTLSSTVGYPISKASDCSISSPLNDQVLVFTTSSSLYKWTPYTLLGVTFNDTSKTVTVTTPQLSTLAGVAISSVKNNDMLIYNSDGNSNLWTNLSALTRYRKMTLSTIYTTALSYPIPTSSTTQFPKGVFAGYKLIRGDGGTIYYSFTVPFDYKLNTQMMLHLRFFSETTPETGLNYLTIMFNEGMDQNELPLMLSYTGFSTIVMGPNSTNSQFKGVSATNIPIGFSISRTVSGSYTSPVFLIETSLVYEVDSYCSSSYGEKA